MCNRDRPIEVLALGDSGLRVTTYVTNSEEETIALGERLARESLPRRGAVLLIGNLGAGKTTLAKGIAAGRGAARYDDVSSPTFTLIHEYGDPVRVYHIDLYRLEGTRQVATLGLEELFDKDALVLIEWGERFPELLPADCVEIYIDRIDEEHRRITLS